MSKVFKQTERQLKYQKKFIEKAKSVHGDKYDYSKVIYENAKTKVCIICPIHGEFEQEPNHHLNGSGCPICGISKNKSKMNKYEFIEKAKKIHDDKYDYSKVIYEKSSEKVCIICPIHGEFWQTPNNHLSGSGCLKCGHISTQEKQSLTTEEFIKRAIKIHGNKYDYYYVCYKNTKEKVIINCRIHGVFKQSFNGHINQKQGCPHCRMVSLENFIKRSNDIHNKKYNYKNVIFNSVLDKVCIICPEHGEFKQQVSKHLEGHGCPKCAKHISKSETELYDYIKSIYTGEVLQSNRSTISPLELDIYIPELKIAFEYNGLFWHSEHNKDRNYHVDKTNACESLGIQLVHIWEDDWLYNQEVTKQMIKAKMHLSKSKHYARKCSIIEPTKQQQKEFLNKHHIQGFGSGSIVYGLQSDLKLVAMMAFKNDKQAYNLNRFASDGCVGAFGKLLKHFRKHHSDKPIISFGSRDVVYRYNNLYVNHGFEEVEIQSPDYMYIENGIRNHKFGYRKNVLVKRFPGELDLSMTEKEMCLKMDIPRIYGCGLIKYQLE